MKQFVYHPMLNIRVKSTVSICILCLCSIMAKAYSFDTLQYKLYIDSIKILSSNSPKESIELGKELLQYVQQKKDNESIIKVMNGLSMAYYYIGDRKQSFQYLLILEKAYIKNNDYDNLSLIYNRIGSIYQDWSINSEALTYFLKGYQLAVKSKNQSRLAQCYNNLGLINKNQGEFDKAFDYFQKAKEIYTKQNDERNLAFTLNYIGMVYKNIGSYDKAIEYFTKSADLKKKLNDKRTLGNSYGNLAETYWLMKDYTRTEQFYKLAIEICSQVNDFENIIRFELSLSRLYTQTNNIERAYNYLVTAERMINKGTILGIRKSLYETYAVYFEKLKEYDKALEYYKKSTALQDSIFNENIQNKIIDIEYLINSEQKEQEINSLRLQNQIAIEKLRKELDFKYILLISIIVLISILLIIYVRYRITQRSKFTIEEKNLHIEKMNEELATVNDELEQRVKERTERLEEEIINRKQVNLQLEQSLKNAEEANFLKDALLANINHEIRTPLSAIIGLAEVLKNKLSQQSSSEINKYLDGIIQSSNRLLNLLNNIIDISRVEANDIKPHFTICNINTVVRKVTDLFIFRINEKHLELIYSYGEVADIQCDETLLFKVLAEVLDNAVKYTDKGQIEVSTSMISMNNEVKISVSDTGIGIDESYIPHVFDTFRQESMGYNRMYQGAGLGLPLSKRLVKLMSGRIEVSSKKNVGTVVSLIFPVSKVKAEVEKQSIITPTATVVAPDAKILLVEDDDFNAMFLQVIMESMAKVTWVKDGNEALNAIAAQKDKPFDLVVLDINLPNEWEGMSLLKVIHQKFPEYMDVPFIAQTAYSLISDQKKIEESGFTEYFSKPIDTQHFTNTIQYLLNKRTIIKNK